MQRQRGEAGNRIWSVVAGCVIAITGGQQELASAAEPAWQLLNRDEAITVLEVMSSSVKGNDTRIRTWTGSYRMDETMLLQGRIAEDLANDVLPDAPSAGARFTKIERALCQFSIDVEADSIYCNVKVEEDPRLINWHTGETVGADLRQIYQKSIITPEHYLKFEPEKTYGPFAEFNEFRPQDETFRDRVAFREPTESGTQERNSVVVDPRSFLLDFPSRDSSGDYATLLRSEDLKDVKRVKESQLSVFRASVGDDEQIKVSYQSPLPNGSIIGLERIYSKVAGYHVIEEQMHRLAEKIVAQKFEWTYRSVDGILIPETHRRRIYTVDGKTINIDRDWRLVESQLNRAIDPATFTMAHFGLKDGDRVLDRIANSLNVVQGEKMVAAQVIEPPPSRWPAVVGVCLLTIAIGGMALRWQWRRRRSRLTTA